jgi:hypothetical protein
MDKYVSALFLLNETKSFFITEPFHYSFCQNTTSLKKMFIRVPGFQIGQQNCVLGQEPVGWEPLNRNKSRENFWKYILTFYERSRKNYCVINFSIFAVFSRLAMYESNSVLTFSCFRYWINWSLTSAKGMIPSGFLSVSLMIW